MLAPDGKLYEAPVAASRFLSPINNPDVLGSGCDYVYRGVVLPKVWRLTAMNYPNFRLGRLIGSACDTIYSDIKPIYAEKPWLKIYPNPAVDEVKLDYNWVEWEKYREVQCRVYDVLGKPVKTFTLPRYSSWQMVDVRTLPAGTYTVYLEADGHWLANAKLEKVE